MSLFHQMKADLWIALSYIPTPKTWSIYKTYGNFITFWEYFSPTMEKVLGAKIYQRLAFYKNSENLEKSYDQLLKNNISFITFGDSSYPQRLRNIPYPPLWLFARGNIKLLHHPKNIALIGTRHPSRYGHDAGFKLAKGLAEKGVCIISGFAMGIDGAAHQGAISIGGKTIAVLGNGLDVDYPKSNLFLKEKIEKAGGLFISEYPLGIEPLAYHFPQRNRIISGLSDGLIFIEGKIKSGGMVTVRHGLDQGKEVFALPGEAGRPGSEGPHTILREGARLITSPKDVLEDMGWKEEALYLSQNDAKGEKGLLSLNSHQKKIYTCLQKEDCSFEQLVNKTQLNVDLLGINLTFMEIEGIIKKSPGNIYHLQG